MPDDKKKMAEATKAFANVLKGVVKQNVAQVAQLKTAAAEARKAGDPEADQIEKAIGEMLKAIDEQNDLLDDLQKTIAK